MRTRHNFSHYVKLSEKPGGGHIAELISSFTLMILFLTTLALLVILFIEFYEIFKTIIPELVSRQNLTLNG